MMKSSENIERKMLKQLAKYPNNYQSAIRTLPQFLVNIAKSSFISLLCNEYMSRRGIDSKPLKGERTIDGNVEIALPSGRWPEPLNEVWSEVFDSQSISLKELKSIRHTSRLLRLIPSKFEGKTLSDNTVRVKFQLQNGQYATTVLRELMQAPPLAYF